MENTRIINETGMEDIRFYASALRGGAPFQVQLSGISYAVNGKYRISRGENYGTTVLEFVASGTGTLQVGGAEFHPTAGDMYLAPGDRAHTYYASDRAPWTKYWINVGGPLVKTLLTGYGLDETYYFPGARTAGAKLAELVETLKSEDASTVHDLTARKFLEIVQLLARARGDAPELADPIAGKIRNELAKFVFRSPPSMADVAAAAALTASSATRRFRRAYGVSPYAWLLDEKIRAAADLLVSTPHPVCAIAHRLGFPDEYYFARLFREKTGLPPGLYRKRPGQPSSFSGGSTPSRSNRNAASSPETPSATAVCSSS